MKVCTKCHIEKDEIEFRKRSDRKKNNSICKNCEANYNRVNYKNKRNIILLRLRKYYSDNCEKCKSRQLEYHYKNRRKIILKFKKRIDEMQPSYIIELLGHRGFSDDIIKAHPELLESQKLILKIKRLCKKQ